jgi:ketosteroid isomerase-like protein
MSITRYAISTLIAGLVLSFTPASAAPSEQAAVLGTVHQFVDAFNKGDTKTVVAACAPSTSIIDDFAPHVWDGPRACADWTSAYDADAKKNKITDGIVTMGTPWHVDVTGDRAYAVVPVIYTYKQNGKPVTESGSVFTVALKKIAAGWRITGWAWAQH